MVKLNQKDQSDIVRFYLGLMDQNNTKTKPKKKRTSLSSLSSSWMNYGSVRQCLEENIRNSRLGHYYFRLVSYYIEGYSCCIGNIIE